MGEEREHRNEDTYGTPRAQIQKQKTPEFGIHCTRSDLAVRQQQSQRLRGVPSLPVVELSFWQPDAQAPDLECHFKSRPLGLEFAFSKTPVAVTAISYHGAAAALGVRAGMILKT